MEKSVEFDDRAYAESVWTPDRAARLEADWEKQRGYWYDLLNPKIPGGNENVLDVGCGVGAFIDLLMTKGKNYIGVDPTPAMLGRAAEKYPDKEFRLGSVYAIPLPPQTSDLTLCWSVLVHLPHALTERAIRELWRVTRRHLFFNLYVSLEDPFIEVKGGWGEIQSAVSKNRVWKLVEELKPKQFNMWQYEGIDLLGGKPFQREIYLVSR